MSETKLGEFIGDDKKDTSNIATQLAKKQRDISVAEFFEKNRHLLGFDNKRKALLTAVKEAVDNSLDACEEADILPEIDINLVDMGNDRFRVDILDNGPGIVKKQVPNIFAKLLYGSKFHSRKQSRGQQGIGISASVMYAQLTTGKPAKITTRISPTQPAYYCELHLNTTLNKPEIVTENEIDNWKYPHGTRVVIDLEASYQKGGQSVDEYVKQTAIVNPHARFIYTNPKGENFVFERATDAMPKKPTEIKPHPYGVELGILIKMLAVTSSRSLQQFLSTEFSRVSVAVAKEICENASLLPNTKPAEVSRQMAEKLLEGIQKTKIMAPPSDCISPIGAELIEKGIKKEVKAEFYTSVTRSPSVYRGNPFIIEAAIAYGGDLPAEGQVQIMRFANRVPLLYQQGACSSVKSLQEINWKSYGLQQSGESIPTGPAIILIHLASVWAPFTSEAKEAIAHYPEIIKEMKLALQECGRLLNIYVSKKKRVHEEFSKQSYIEKYLPHVSEALQQLVGFSDTEKVRVSDNLKKILEKSRKTQEMEESLEKFREKAKNIESGNEDDFYSEEESEEGSAESDDEEKPKKKKKQDDE